MRYRAVVAFVLALAVLAALLAAVDHPTATVRPAMDGQVAPVPTPEDRQ